MVTGSKVKSAFLSGIGLCVVSALLLLLGILELQTQNADIGTIYFFVPLFFLSTGIISIALSRKRNSKGL